MTQDEKRELWRRMREPTYAFVALVVLLAVNVVLGATLPFRGTSMVIAAIATIMVATVLLFSMEVRKEPPLIRLFSGLGFFWVAILFSLTLVDYLTR